MSMNYAAGFDADQADTEDHTGPDRLGIHILWEALLALAFAGALFLLYRGESVLATSEGRDSAITALVPLLLLGTAMAASFRVGAVNLAAGGIAVLAAATFSANTDRGLAVALLAAVGLALACGLVLAILVVVLQAPGWLASAGVAAVAWLWAFEHVNLAQLSPDPFASLPVSTAWIWLIAVAALSIFGGVVGALNGWRNRFGACRDTPVNAHDVKTKSVTAAALTGSAVLSGMAGVWVVWTASDGAAVMTGLDPLLVGVFPIAAVLLGGTSVLGRRGGILGTVLASLLLMTLLLLHQTREWDFDPLWTLLAAVGVGIVVTRLVEAFGTPAEPSVKSSNSDMTTFDMGAGMVPTQPTVGYDAADIDPYRRPDFDGHH
ncbi:MAG TPA: hypothetical protein H9881_13785 [Candidatus Stackebrandtia excrementipullorum]|nr:hypothetical protein [Candidatus Stackebrandtia excrementipullorum]